MGIFLSHSILNFPSSTKQNIEGGMCQINTNGSITPVPVDTKTTKNFVRVLFQMIHNLIEDCLHNLKYLASCCRCQVLCDYCECFFVERVVFLPPVLTLLC